MSYNSKNYEAQGGDEWVIGGKLTVEAGATIDASAGGIVILPTADPHVAGAVWNNAGTLAVSAG